MMLGDRIAATTQGIMERMGVRENEIDSPAVIENFRHIEQLGTSVKEIRKRLSKQQISQAAQLEQSKALTESFKTAASNNKDEVCRQMFQKISEFQEIMNDMHRGLASILTNEVLKPLEKFEKNDLKDCSAAKKKYDKVRISYETSVAQLRSVGKKQKINLNKVLEAEVKKDTFEEAFRSISQETTSILELAIKRHDYVILDSLCFYLNAYQSFFSNGFEYLKDLKELLTQSKSIVSERKKTFDEELQRAALETQKREKEKETGKRQVFGRDLVEISNGDQFPRVIKEAIDDICSNGLSMEGIFRISPAKTQLCIAIDQIEKGVPLNWKELPAHVTAGVIKEFLRELPDPLLTKDLYDDWIKIDDLPEEQEEKEINRLMSLLPGPNRALLRRLMSMCVKITENEEKNKMGAKQLAIVLAPNILYGPDSLDPAKIVVSLAASNQCIFKLINYFESHKDEEITISSSPMSPRIDRHQMLQQIRNHNTRGDIHSPSPTRQSPQRVPLSSLKPPTKTKLVQENRKPKPVVLTPIEDSDNSTTPPKQVSTTRATTEFKIITEEEVEVIIEEPEPVTVEQLALMRKQSLMNIKRPNISELKTTESEPVRSTSAPRMTKAASDSSGWVRGVLKKEDFEEDD